MPDRCVLDTNVVAYFFRGDTRAELYRPYLADKELGLSFQTLAELQSWALIRAWGARRQGQLAAYLNRFTVYYADDGLCQAWAAITAEAVRTGSPITPADAWIAAPCAGYTAHPRRSGSWKART